MCIDCMTRGKRGLGGALNVLRYYLDHFNGMHARRAAILSRCLVLDHERAGQLDATLEAESLRHQEGEDWLRTRDGVRFAELVLDQLEALHG